MTKRITSKAIGKAIQEHTGIPDVLVWRGEGYHYFYSENDDTNDLLMRMSSTSVYVINMNQQSIEEWVQDFCYEAKQEVGEALYWLFYMGEGVDRYLRKKAGKRVYF